MIITAFHPKYLLNKLSAAKTSVQDWRQLVESVKIDWTYDGSIFKPHILDIPSQNELVKGSYSMPAYAKHIRVKITDLLSESLELNWPDINEPVGYES